MKSLQRVLWGRWYRLKTEAGAHSAKSDKEEDVSENSEDFAKQKVGPLDSIPEVSGGMGSSLCVNWTFKTLRPSYYHLFIY